MPHLAIFMICSAAILPTAAGQQSGTDLVGCDSRAVDLEVYRAALQIIEYRIETGRDAEPLLILSAYSDPDVLGLIATDAGLPLAAREISANIILDQLYISDPYFQICAKRYFGILANSREPSLRLKGNIGLAALEYWSYISDPGAQSNPPQLLRLRFAAEKERDTRVRTILERLLSGDPSELAGFALRSDGDNSIEPYRQLDSNPYPTKPEVEDPSGEIAGYWERYRASADLNSKLEVPENPETPALFEAELREALRELQSADAGFLQGFMARFAATMLTEPLERPYTDPILQFFRRVAVNDRDPYSRALALAPICAGPKDAAMPFLLERLSNDQAPLVRLSAAHFLRLFCGEVATRQRMIAQFRSEPDQRVKLRILHSLVWPHPELPPPDVLSFMLARIRDQQEVAVLEYVVIVLGNARVQTAIEPLANLAHQTSDPILRERIAEAMRRIRGG